MPMDRRLYPADWEAISWRIRFERAGGQCECMGECGLHRTHPGPQRCTERHGEPGQWTRGTIVLTTAHLCHDPSCRDEMHLRAMCQRCHLCYDGALHRQHARERRATRTSRSSGRSLGCTNVP